MACGNNHVSRDYLSSQPSSPRTAASALSRSQLDAVVAAQRLPSVSIDGGKQRQAFVSRLAKDGTIDYFVGEDGEQGHHPELHVHVIHELNGNVKMHVTDRRNGQTKHSHQIELKSPDGNQVRAAERALADVLRSLR